MAKRESLATIRDRYRGSSKKDKGRILDEFISVTGHHRKHGVRLLDQSDFGADKPNAVRGQRIYDEAVIVVWEAADRICRKRLKSALPNLVESMERHGHLDPDAEVCQRLLEASAATLDRSLKPIRSTAGRRHKRRRRQYGGRQVPVHTYDDWDRPPPGFREIDLVAIDVCTGWTEAVPLLAREQSLVVEGLAAIGDRLLFPIRGTDSDNDGAFSNETLIQFCAGRDIEFTRSGAYRKYGQPRSSRGKAPWSAVSSVMAVTRTKSPSRPGLNATER